MRYNDPRDVSQPEGGQFQRGSTRR